MVKKIGILTYCEFPEGMAPTTRILAYSKGLVDNNVKVEIFSFKRIYNDRSNNIAKSGKVNGAGYTYLHIFHSLSKKIRILRIFDEIILRINLILKIRRSGKHLPFDCFFISFDDNHSFAAYLKLFSFFRIPLIFVADEFPIPIRDFMKDEVPEPILIKYKHYHKRFKARILMSDSLKDFYNKYVIAKPTFILNTIIDTSRFSTTTISEDNHNSIICYMGNMDLRKDNVQNIIEAFSLIQNKFPDIELHLYGIPSEEHFSYLQNRVHFLKLEGKVHFKGKASYNEVPNILASSKILVNSQPITKRAQGGFPTKLGEYLLSSRPSIFTDSGDIGMYIQDGVHAFIAPPENPIAFAEKIVYILENDLLSEIVATNGEKYIRENFDSIHQAKKLISFLEETLHN